MIKKILLTIITIPFQIIIGHILAFFGTYALNIGNGWELIIWPFWITVGVWGTGTLTAKLTKRFNKKQYTLKLIGTAIGSGIGVILILITPAIGFIQLIFPLIGALIGFYFPIQKLFIYKK
jgi:hypothetical protein